MEIEKIIAKTDYHLSRNDFKSAETLLEYWHEDAKGRDLIPILNELLGLYRKTKQREKAFAVAAEEDQLLIDLGLENTESAGTICINIATVYSAFGQYAEALSYYEKAERILENSGDKRLIASLYNNMGTCLTALGRTAKAYAYLYLALSALKKEKNAELDRAITFLNLADLALYNDNEREKEAEFLSEAEKLFEDEAVERDGYYAFVAEKCAPGFRAHGRNALAAELLARSKRIYERN